MISTGSPMRAQPLSWTLARADTMVTVCTELPQPLEGPGFEPLDLMTDDGPCAALYGPLRQSTGQLPPGRFLGMTGFRLFTDLDSPPLSFTLSVQLVAEDGEAIRPEAGQRLDRFTMACGAGVRLQELRTVPAGPLGDVPLFTAMYITRTEAHGTLLAEFGTTHTDAAFVFAQLFDALAGGFTIH